MNAELTAWMNRGDNFIFNNNSIFYIAKGRGPVLLVLHGYPYNSFDFKAVLDELSAHFLVIIPDMAGMGFSSKPEAYAYSFEDHAAMYVALSKHLGVREAHLLSHDLGNSVVQELLAQQEEGSNTTAFHILSIAFLNGGLFTDVYRPRLIQRLLSRSPKPFGRLLSRIIPRGSVAKATASLFGPKTKPSPDIEQAFWEILNYNQGKRLAWKIGRLVFAKTKYQPRWIRSMQNTTVPMCFINGPADPNSGSHMVKRYRELIPNSKVFLLDDHIGHWPQLEDPEGTVNRYLCFMREAGFRL